MARLRKFSAYRNIERPYTRKSKFKNKSFVRASPNCRVVRFDMGNEKAEFDTTLELVSKDDIQIRHNAIESARQTSNRLLDQKVGKTNYKMKIMIYPHHILRENPLASGAGADRMSTGMKKSFGKPIGIAARVKKGQTLIRLKVNKNNLDAARLALKRASHKMPCSCNILTVSN
ncbi:50S ribosomal protein L16 [Candidatus Woesearchaeota archaeon]|nr:MAG: 50S ribosomal protein L16 [Candidatus Woesearchaeota archaeon]